MWVLQTTALLGTCLLTRPSNPLPDIPLMCLCFPPRVILVFTEASAFQKWWIGEWWVTGHPRIMPAYLAHHADMR